MNKTLVLSTTISNIIIKLAREQGKAPEILLTELLETKLDPKISVNVYLELHKKYLDEGKKLLEKGDLTQASEKYWSAVTALLNAIGVIRREPHYSHRELSLLVEKLAIELKRPELSKLFAVAERLHANFYHNFIKSKETFEEYVKDIIKLVKILKEYLQQKMQ